MRRVLDLLLGVLRLVLNGFNLLSERHQLGLLFTDDFVALRDLLLDALEILELDRVGLDFGVVVLFVPRRVIFDAIDFFDFLLLFNDLVVVETFDAFDLGFFVV